MDDEDDIAPPGGWEPRNLEAMSVEQLEAYIAVLEGEIDRVKADIEAKKAHRSSAEAFFRK